MQLDTRPVVLSGPRPVSVANTCNLKRHVVGKNEGQAAHPSNEDVNETRDEVDIQTTGRMSTEGCVLFTHDGMVVTCRSKRHWIKREGKR